MRSTSVLVLCLSFLVALSTAAASGLAVQPALGKLQLLEHDRVDRHGVAVAVDQADETKIPPVMFVRPLVLSMKKSVSS